MDSMTHDFTLTFDAKDWPYKGKPVNVSVLVLSVDETDSEAKVTCELRIFEVGSMPEQFLSGNLPNRFTDKSDFDPSGSSDGLG